MSAKITIIGAGSVGSTIAYTLAMENSGASEIVLIDINKEKVLGEVMDIAQEPSSVIRYPSWRAIMRMQRILTSYHYFRYRAQTGSDKNRADPDQCKYS